MKFTAEEFIASVRELYSEWQEKEKKLTGESVRLPDFEEAIDHVARFGLDPINDEDPEGVLP
jgi:hypothetical protein